MGVKPRCNGARIGRNAQLVYEIVKYNINLISMSRLMPPKKWVVNVVSLFFGNPWKGVGRYGHLDNQIYRAKFTGPYLQE